MNLDHEIDPRKQPFALVPCPNCGEHLEIMHKTLRLSMWRQDRILEAHPNIEQGHELNQLAEISCHHCRKEYVVTYSFIEFAMSAYAFRLMRLTPINY